MDIANNKNENKMVNKYQNVRSGIDSLNYVLSYPSQTTKCFTDSTLRRTDLKSSGKLKLIERRFILKHKLVHVIN